jgi:1-acyl-sn-glycerol-3-phosphate acyltransferase
MASLEATQKNIEDLRIRERDLDSPVVDALYFLIRKIFGPLVRLIWVKSVQGRGNIPLEGPVIVAFNHESYFDFIAFIAISPRNIHYLSAEKFFTNTFWRPLMRVTGQIHVDRTSKDKRNLHGIVYEHLKLGKMLGIFPEGTRAPDKERMLRAFSGIAKYAVKANVPVVPVGVTGTYDVMSRHDKKPRFIKNISFNIGEPMHLEEYKRCKMNKAGFRIITDKIMLEISKLSGKPYPHYGISDKQWKRRKKKNS